MAYTRENRRGGVLVLAAHPDDETIGCGGLLGRVSDGRVAYLTDGAPSDASLRPIAFRDDPAAYRTARADEARSALGLLGIDRDRILHFGAVDQEASYSMLSLVENLLEVFEVVRPRIVITHPYEGGHPDHDTAAFVVRAACTLYERRHGCTPALWEMTSYHARDAQLVTGTFLDTFPVRAGIVTDGNGPADDILTLNLSPDERRRKELMMRCFATQKEVLASFGCETERFRRAPRYDFSRPPHHGSLYYEQLGWPLSGHHWRKLASDAEHRLSGAS
jgi:LmbE family N-acetylglucosaminyl deacetylase